VKLKRETMLQFLLLERGVKYMAKPGPDPISKDECRGALRLATERLGHPPTLRVIAKSKGKTLEDAREDMETLREYIHDLAEEARQIQPADPHKE